MILDEFAQWLSKHQLPCIYKKYLGLECPGCGMQRAFIELLRGNFVESLRQYPALIPILVMLALLLVHIVFKIKKAYLWLKFLFILNAIIIVIHYFYKILN